MRLQSDSVPRFLHREIWEISPLSQTSAQNRQHNKASNITQKREVGESWP